MKKILSIVALLLMAGSMVAATINMSMQNYFRTDDEAPLSCTKGGVSLTAEKASAASSPVYNINKGLCIYAGGTLTIDAGTDHIQSVTFTININGMKQLASLSCSTGTLTQKSQTAPSWTGSANKVILTVGANATYGSSPSKAGQLCFTDITITTDGDGSGDESTLLPEYPFTYGQVLYYGTAYSSTPNYQLWLCSEDIILDLANSSAEGENGSIVRLDLFNSSSTNMCGTYTIAEDGVYDKNGGASKTYSYWTTYIDGDFVEYRLTKGTIQVECVSKSHYTITYDLQEINNGMHHVGRAINIPITAVTENGQTFTLTNDCPDTDIETIDSEKGTEKIIHNRQLYIHTQQGDFDATGRQIR